ncbi:hypothetical protein [Methylocella sp.]|uniref:hypothetical protein n=1 Tax=Methylocella sp. TaxID=1978226 RepID=UPI0037849963
MAHPWRDKSGVWYLRERVPHALKKTVKGRAVALPVAEGTHTIKLGDMALLSLRTKEKGEALRRWTAAREALLRFYDGCRLGEITLDFKQAMALAREHFDELAEIAEGEPGEPRIWEALQRLNERVRETPEKMARWYGETVDSLLERRGLTVNDVASRDALLRAVANAWESGTARGLRRARGDFSEDGSEAKFPEWTPPTPAIDGRATEAAGKPAEAHRGARGGLRPPESFSTAGKPPAPHV